MDFTQDLDLGKDDPFGKEADKKKSGFNSSKPFFPIQNEPSQNDEGLGFTDKYQDYPEDIRDYKLMEGELSKLSSDASTAGSLRRAKQKAMDDFMASSMTPFFRETLGMNMMDPEKSDFDDPDALFGRFDTHFKGLEAQASDSGFFGGETDAAKAAKQGLSFKPKYGLIRDKYNRLKIDLDQFTSAENTALDRKRVLTEAKYSLQENFKRAADNY